MLQCSLQEFGQSSRCGLMKRRNKKFKFLEVVIRKNFWNILIQKIYLHFWMEENVIVMGNSVGFRRTLGLGILKENKC